VLRAVLELPRPGIQAFPPIGDFYVTIDQQLLTHGYATVRTCIDIHSDGTRTETFAVAGYQPRTRPDAKGQPIYNYTPPNIATFSFAYLDQRGADPLSPIARRFADALISTLVPGHEPKRFFRKARPVDESVSMPLVRITDNSLEFLFRLDEAWFENLRLDGRDLFAHGVATRDERAPLALQADTRDIPVGDSATWLFDRSPLTVPRSALPEWRAEQTSLALYNLVEQWAANGDVSVCDAYKEPPLPGGYSPEAMLAREGITIAVPTDEWTGEAPGQLFRERGRWG
jgi:hypothetical protein